MVEAIARLNQSKLFDVFNSRPIARPSSNQQAELATVATTNMSAISSALCSAASALTNCAVIAVPMAHPLGLIH